MKKLPFRVLGHRISTLTGFQDVWPGEAPEIIYLREPEEIEVVSEGASNTTTGTGVRSVELLLLNAKWERVRLAVELNGTTPVSVPGGPFWRVQKFHSYKAGSTGVTEGGPIDVRTTGGGDILQVMPVGMNESRGACWTLTPKDWPYGLTSWSASVAESQTPMGSSKFQLQFRKLEEDQAWHMLDSSPELGKDSDRWVATLAPFCGKKDSIFDVRISCDLDLGGGGVALHVSFEGRTNDLTIPFDE